MKTYFYTVVFPAISQCFEKAVTETGNKLSIIHVFITSFANNVYFKVSIMFLIYFFIVKKTKQDI